MNEDRDIYLVTATGHSLMVTTLPKNLTGDPRALIALELGLIAQDVRILLNLGPCEKAYSLNLFLGAQFGIRLPDLASAVEGYWHGPRFQRVPPAMENEDE